ncbi:hypothetical protein DFP72DRAFT_1163391 [Ephemerocybe angulata]|uniref:Uncharacterized protein n=1 Tax=Ephemerocybe angulata TaxID=980116 RepID=A0A8H6IHT5_9AGAR|nr:hypothetical protein DFP72DRAFT_1163391 [Tulosesus angulatus]
MLPKRVPALPVGSGTQVGPFIPHLQRSLLVARLPSGHDTSSRAFLQSVLKASIALSFVTFGTSLAPLRQWRSRYLAPPACAITIAFDITLLFLSYGQQAREHKERSHQVDNQDVELEAAKHPLPKSATQPTRPAFLSLSPTYHSIAIWALNLIIVIWLTVVLLSLSLIVLGDENGATYDAEVGSKRFFWYLQIAGMAAQAMYLRYGVGLFWSLEIKRNTLPLAFVSQAYDNTDEKSTTLCMIWAIVFFCANGLVVGTTSFVLHP